MRSIVAPTITIARRLRGRPNALRESTTSSSSIDPSSRLFASSSSSFSGADDLPSPGSAGVAARDLRRRIEEGGEGVDDEDGRWSSSRSAGRRRRRSARQGTSMSTRLSHAGLASFGGGDDDDGCRDDNPPLSPPIELATTYERPADGEYGERGRVYSRSCNPTRRLLEEAMGRLEMMTPPPAADDDDYDDYDHDDDGGPSSCDPDAIAPTFAFSSGMAAATSLLLACESPTRVLLPSDVYHGLPTLLRSSLVVGRGVSYESVDMTDVDGLGRSIERNVASMAAREEDDGGGGGGGGGGTLVVWIETPSNPLCRVTDIRAVCDAVGMVRARTTGGDDDDDDDDNDAGDVRILTVVDSTWAPPCITLPLDLGADVVLHSGTKYLAGHSDALIGIVSSSPLTSDGRRTASRLRIVQTSVGAVASPLESWLTLRGLRTLHLRVERQCETAMRIAMYLNGHESVMACHYPGLPSHPGHDVARRQMRDGMFGGMLSFELESECAAMAVAGAVRVIRRATSLGGTETLIEHRASIEPKEGRTSPVGLLRLSVGLEDAEDLIRDLEMALEVATRVMKSVEGR